MFGNHTDGMMADDLLTVDAITDITVTTLGVYSTMTTIKTTHYQRLQTGKLGEQ